MGAIFIISVAIFIISVAIFVAIFFHQLLLLLVFLRVDRQVSLLLMFGHGSLTSSVAVATFFLSFGRRCQCDLLKRFGRRCQFLRPPAVSASACHRSTSSETPSSMISSQRSSLHVVAAGRHRGGGDVAVILEMPAQRAHWATPRRW